MSNNIAWHLERVSFKSGWREIGDKAEFALVRQEVAILAEVSRVTETDFLDGEVRVPTSSSSVELFLTLHLHPVRPVIQDWFRQRQILLFSLKDTVSQKHWGRGKETTPETYAALAHLYALLVAENVRDPISELQILMNTPTREAAAMRIKTIRDKGFLTSPSRGVAAGKATPLAQDAFASDWVEKYYR